MRAHLVLLLCTGCRFGTMGNWVLESADDSFVLSEAAVFASERLEDERSGADGRARVLDFDDTGAPDDGDFASQGLEYHVGFSVEFWSKQADRWVRYGAGSMALLDASDGSLVDTYGLVMVIGANESDDAEGDVQIDILGDATDASYGYWFFNSAGDQDEYEWEEDDYPDNLYDQFSTVWSASCERKFRTLDCGEAVFARPEADEERPTTVSSSGEGEGEGGADTGEPEDTSYWYVRCSGAPGVKCPFPKNLEGRHEATCEASRNDRTYPVDAWVNGDLEREPGRVSVSLEVDSSSLEMDIRLSGEQTDEDPFRFEGDCTGTVEEGGDEVNLSEHDWGGSMEWREEG